MVPTDSPKESRLLSYLYEQARLGCADWVNGAYFVVVSAGDVELFPELKDCYAIRFSSGASEFALLGTETEYDEAIQLALCGLNDSPDPGPMLQ